MSEKTVAVGQGIVGAVVFLGLMFNLSLCLFKMTLVMIFLALSSIAGLISTILLFMDAFSVVETPLVARMTRSLSYIYTTAAFISVSLRMSAFLDHVPFDFRRPAFVKSVPETLAAFWGIIMFSTMIIRIVNTFIHLSELDMLTFIVYTSGTVTMALGDCYYVIYLFRMIRKNRFRTSNKDSKKMDTIKILTLLTVKMALLFLAFIVGETDDVRINLISYNLTVFYVVTDGVFILIFKHLATRFVPSTTTSAMPVSK